MVKNFKQKYISAGVREISAPIRTVEQILKEPPKFRPPMPAGFTTSNVETKINWYSGTDDIKYMGPFKSQLEAWDALKGLEGFPVKGSKVWCTTDTY